MGKILLKHENGLVKEKIVQILTNPDRDEQEKLGTENKQTQDQDKLAAQTKIDGILCPLVRINDITLRAGMLESFRLYTDFVPKVELTIIDNNEIIKSVQNPNSDNKLLIQIIPPFDDAYKKVNLSFYCTRTDVVGNKIFVKAVYNIEGLYNFRLKAFGQLTTYEFCEKVASELKLGLASDMENTTDKRWIYCPSKSYLDTLQNEMLVASIKESPIDMWVDFYDNINIIDLFDCWSKTISLPDVYITQIENRVDANAPKVPVVKSKPIITNDKRMSMTQLYVDSYTGGVSSNNISEGTDKIVEYYSIEKLDKESFFIQDGNIKNDIFTKYEYAGEFVGDYDYVKQRTMNKKLKDIILSNYIEVRLKKPCLGLLKGGRVQFDWYETDTTKTQVINELNDDVATNIEHQTTSTDEQETDRDGRVMVDKSVAAQQVLNKTISGQYYICDSSIEWSLNSGRMEQVLKLSRPQHEVHDYVFENNAQKIDEM